jgi:hypothetical protein
LLWRLPARAFLLYQHAGLPTPHGMIEPIIHFGARGVKRKFIVLLEVIKIDVM